MVRFLPIAAAAATGILVGSAMVATRFVIDQTAPASLALLRYSIGFCCLLPPVLLSARVRFERRDLLPIGLLGITQFGILIALLNYALQFIPSARAALIFATMPLLTMMLATALGHERLTLAKTLGVLLTIVGVGFALGEKAVQRGGVAHEWVGELAVFASALSGAICSVLYRPYLRKYPTLPVSAFAMLASVGFLAVLAGCGRIFRLPTPLYRGRLAGRRLHRDQQRHWLLSLAVGLEPHDTDEGHRVPGAQSHHSGRAGSFASRRKDFNDVIPGARLRRSRPVDRTLGRAHGAHPIERRKGTAVLARRNLLKIEPPYMLNLK